ncbi:helix-turn-helix transcriptional regulator [Nocardia vinacea]|uniref:helix-turn-helix transcriptional regulator n=1 Tax=Nocardia vinacea TaxID=96468 RepID=UPI0033F004C3
MNDPVIEPDRQPAAVADRLAREIRRLRLEAGLSQRELATKIGYSRQYVSMTEWEDANLPSQELVAAIDAALGASGALVALRAQAKTDQNAARRQSRSGVPDSNALGGGPVMVPVVVGGRVVLVPLDPRIVGAAGTEPAGPPHDSDDWDAVFSRRSLIAQGFAAATSTAYDHNVFLTTDPVEAFIRSKRISDGTITGFTAVTHLLAGQRQSVTPDALLSLIVAHRDSVAALFRRATDDSVKNQLGFLLGETSIVASRLWSAIGNRSMALANCAFARRLADDISDPKLGAMARIFESNLHSDAATLIGSDGDIVAGLRMLGDAAAIADLLPPAIQARIAAEQAQAYAVLELPRECQDALARAHRAVDAIGDEDQTGLFSDWNSTRLLVYEGTCWLFLNEPHRAIAVLNEQLEVTGQGNQNVALAARVDLASAHVLAGELEEGCRILGDTYASLAAMGNRRGIDRARRALERLGHRKNEQPVRELEERIEGIGVQR